jgi:uncharacterized membrane protein
MRALGIDGRLRRGADISGTAVAASAIGAGLGAGLMYALDPARGKVRRARARDRVARALRRGTGAADTALRDLSNEARGVVASARARVEHRDEGAVPDAVVEARVRSKIGRWVTRPHAVEVRARDGIVMLGGDVLAHEVDDLVDAVSRVPGVRGCERRFYIHEKADIPSLLGGGLREGERFELFQRRWSPSARLMAALAGGGLIVAVARGERRGAAALILGAAGAALLGRAVTNVGGRELLGLRPGRGIAVQKTIHVAAPVEGVFDFFMDLENFPLFMSRVLDVDEVEDGAYRWRVAGPLGIPVSWKATIGRVEQNALIEWESVPGSMIETWGRVRFIDEGARGTRIDVSLRYNPPLGAIGHAIAKLFGADPKSELDADLLRMKTMIEQGCAPRDASAAARR